MNEKGREEEEKCNVKMSMEFLEKKTRKVQMRKERKEKDKQKMFGSVQIGRSFFNGLFASVATAYFWARLSWITSRDTR